jgi:putative hydrolase of the HAD superfamily
METDTALDGVKAAIFDVGGTLALPDSRRMVRITRTLGMTGFSCAGVRAAFYEALNEVDNIFMRGLGPPPDSHREGWMIRRVWHKLGLTDAEIEHAMTRLAIAHAKRHIWSEVAPEASSVLSRLRENGIRLAAISNTEDGRLSELLERINLAHYFELAIDSTIVGCAKPDPGIFRIATAHLGLSPRECVYIGDSYTFDVCGAAAVGMRPILLDPFGLHRHAGFLVIRSLRELLPSQSSRRKRCQDSHHQIPGGS